MLRHMMYSYCTNRSHEAIVSQTERSDAIQNRCIGKRRKNLAANVDAIPGTFLVHVDNLGIVKHWPIVRTFPTGSAFQAVKTLLIEE